MDPGIWTKREACRRWKQASMVQIRKHYSPTFQAQVEQEVRAGDKSLGQIAAQDGIHPNRISKWRRAALQAMPTASDEESQMQAQAQLAALKAQHEKEKEELHAQIDRLTVQVHGLQKKCSRKCPGLPAWLWSSEMIPNCH
jgi:transposase